MSYRNVFLAVVALLVLTLGRRNTGPRRTHRFGCLPRGYRPWLGNSDSGSKIKAGQGRMLYTKRVDSRISVP